MGIALAAGELLDDAGVKAALKAAQREREALVSEFGINERTGNKSGAKGQESGWRTNWIQHPILATYAMQTGLYGESHTCPYLGWRRSAERTSSCWPLFLLVCVVSSLAVDFEATWGQTGGYTRLAD